MKLGTRRAPTPSHGPAPRPEEELAVSTKKFEPEFSWRSGHGPFRVSIKCRTSPSRLKNSKELTTKLAAKWSRGDHEDRFQGTNPLFHIHISPLLTLTSSSPTFWERCTVGATFSSVLTAPISFPPLATGSPSSTLSSEYCLYPNPQEVSADCPTATSPTPSPFPTERMSRG